MDAWISSSSFFSPSNLSHSYWHYPFALLLGWQRRRAGEGRLSATRDSNEISQTLHHVGFLMIILHFVDNQQNVLNQGPALDQVCVIT